MLRIYIVALLHADLLQIELNLGFTCVPVSSTDAHNIHVHRLYRCSLLSIH